MSARRPHVSRSILNFLLIPRFGMMGAAGGRPLELRVPVRHPGPDRAPALSDALRVGTVIRLAVVGVGVYAVGSLITWGSMPAALAGKAVLLLCARSRALRGRLLRGRGSGAVQGARAVTSGGDAPLDPSRGASMERRARVLFIIDELDIGGTEQQILELVKRLDRDRYVPMVCLLPARTRLRGDRVRRCARVHAAQARRSWTCASSRASSALMRRERIDIAQTYLFTANTWATAGGDHRPRP